MAAIVLAGGTLVDGTGSPSRRADVTIDAGRVAAIDFNPRPRSYGDVIDVNGLIICPGFVDIHTHSDLTLLSTPLAPSKVGQGVTTEVVGNCGLGLAPRRPDCDVAALRQANSYLDLDPAVEVRWNTTHEYLESLAAARPALNVATLTGHVPLRVAAVGFDARRATPGETADMQSLLAESLAAGSVGLSTGLVYPPACYADEEEMTALGEVVAAHDRLFSWHVRDYADALIPSVRQALDVARETGCRTQISHLTAVGRRNWGAVRSALDLIDTARDNGCRVNIDMYPYLFGNAPLSQLLPTWAQDGGGVGLERLADESLRARVRTEWVDLPSSWDEIIVSWVPAGHPAESLLGRDIAAIAADNDASGDDVALDLLAQLGQQVLIVAGGRSESDLRDVLGHPAAVIASDGLALDPYGATGSGSPHPRSYGCFPRYLAHYVDDNDASFAAAIRRCTSGPADVARLSERGRLAPGMKADVVVLDPVRLTDRATIAAPQLSPDGIELVLVNGAVVVDHGRHTGQRAGEIIRA